MGRSRRQLLKHINYLRTKSNSSPSSSRGRLLRESIVANISSQVADEEDYEQDMRDEEAAPIVSGRKKFPKGSYTFAFQFLF